MQWKPVVAMYSNVKEKPESRRPENDEVNAMFLVRIAPNVSNSE